MKYLLLLFLALPLALTAQQIPYTTAFSSAHFGWNPAMTASWDYMETNAIYSQQWLGFDQAPRTIMAGFQAPLLNLNMSFGAQLMQDQAGPLQQTGLSITYAYQLDLGYQGRLAIGLLANFSQYRFDATDLLAYDQDDLLLGMGEGTQFQPNFGFGAFYTSVDPDEWDDSYFFAGLSAMQIIPGQLTFAEVNETATIKQAFHAFGTIGYRFTQDDSFIEPSLQLLYSAKNLTHFQFDVKYEWYNAFWAGLSMDSAFRAGLQLGFILPGLGDGALRVGGMGSYNISNRGAEQGTSFQALVAYRYYL